MNKTGSFKPALHQAWLSWWKRVISLLLVFGLTKAMIVLNRCVDGEGAQLLAVWTPFALLVQDVWTVGCIAVWDALILRITWRWQRIQRIHQWSMWVLYALFVGYVALNIPIIRVFSTPLTFPMWGAAGLALADSIRIYVTWTNAMSVLVVLAAAFALPRQMHLRPTRRQAALVWGACVGICLVGPTAIRQVDVLGLHRNPLWILASTTWAQGHYTPSQGALSKDHIPLPTTKGSALDLRHLAGVGRGRHVIWINLESTGARYLRPYGARRDAMPHLTQLARQALLFSHAYAAFPSSIKGLFSMLCARPPAAHTSTQLYQKKRLPCDDIAAQFAKAGYRTGMFHSGWFHYLGMDDVVADRGFHVLKDAGHIKSKYHSSFGVDEASTVRQSLHFIDKRKPGERFFLMYLPIAGHHPYESPGKGPRPFGHKTALDRYQSDLYFGDTALGALVEGLRKRKLLSKTVWVIMGDHGQAFFQHKGNFAHSLFVYEENVHVPLLVVLPGVLDRTIRVPQIASLIDVAPTLLTIMGLPIPRQYQGRSLLKPKPGRARFFADQAIWQVGLRHGRWKLIYEMSSGRAKLFDLSKDPGEHHNVANQFPQRTNQYIKHLKAWSQRQQVLIRTPQATPRPATK